MLNHPGSMKSSHGFNAPPKHCGKQVITTRVGSRAPMKKDNEFCTMSEGACNLREPMKPGDGGRKWIKLWVNEWLDGTTRWQTTSVQRAFWTDLLAHAGRGRVGGVVCSGQDADRLIGYPLKWFEALSPEPIDVLETFALFERTGKVRVEVSDDALKLYVVHVLNWGKYQSEYARTKKYRKPKTFGSRRF